ncbi:MAG: hypothetical protein AVDCRST_MAG07-3129 [uncultured Frankineae bacterium]|uniref:Uncharacterized protein n=1 Tax=uncultured Frankineae bacterium TaxID=437475 RepID=A0A6J4MB04_9ACTN|nr:MAG: hypothetical protein AVDCRST_MAG07-3129 [uncultured Frankineae bacterium]
MAGRSCARPDREAVVRHAGPTGMTSRARWGFPLRCCRGV